MLSQQISILTELNIVSMTVRILLAVICGGLIGRGRWKSGKAAGLRTHILVCLGTAITMLTGQYMFLLYPNIDPSRIGAQAISALGFLGAGTIIVQNDRTVSGLTTAAGLWASACVGLACGAGIYELAIVGTICILFVESVLKRDEK